MNDTDTIDHAGDASPPTTALVRSAAVRSIVVNGRSHLFAGDEIGTKDLARLAFPEQQGRSYAALTVAYEGGPLVAGSGLMTGRTTTPVAEGQSFSVSLTDKS
ncbi:hypothetical protein [Sphingomonas corticis]|jgi:hypothetical protein|uniref:Multi-ubiquitin domain-containing protein n=1 Tax=Sphingomonas corticis TaxID=2722791 RepID=A0ABX1CP58_9SPHN|nr:hypothetical protein [Sphingomonas corticis]NJR77507.1 hypothetical protein [Sphingomonas corticis]